MPTDKKSVDAYNENAKKWADSKKNKASIYHTFLEKPAMYGKLPDLKNKDVLCIGCGSGEEVEHLHLLGARRVVGIDIAEELITVAKQQYPHLEFQTMDMEKLDFPSQSFDFAFSSLTMHYLLDWKNVLTSLHKILRKDGIFLSSINHPSFSAFEKSEDEKVKIRRLGYDLDKKQSRLTIYGNYFESQSFDIKVNSQFIVKNCHRSLSLLVNDIVSSGFEILDIVEPKALEESKEIDRNFWEIHQRIPEFMVFEVRKK